MDIGKPVRIIEVIPQEDLVFTEPIPERELVPARKAIPA